MIDAEAFAPLPVLTHHHVFRLDALPAIDLTGLKPYEVEPKCVTLHAIFLDYILEHIKPHTRGARRASLAAWCWVTVLGPDRDVQTIKRGDGRLVAEALQARKLGAASVRRIMSVGVAAFHHAKKEGRFTGDIPQFQLPEASSSRVRVYSHEEQALIMAAPKPRRIQLLCHLGFGTGARSEAMEELPWSNVDLEKRTIDFRIKGAVYRNKRRAVVPINDSLLRRLTAAKAYRDANYPDDPYVIGRSPNGGRATTYHHFHALLVDLGIYEPGMGRHTMRHTVATRLLEADVPIHKVAQILGDKVAMVESTYAHVRPIALLKCANELR